MRMFINLVNLNAQADNAVIRAGAVVDELRFLTMERSLSRQANRLYQRLRRATASIAAMPRHCPKPAGFSAARTILPLFGSGSGTGRSAWRGSCLSVAAG